MLENLFNACSMKSIFKDVASDKDVFTLVHEAIKRASPDISPSAAEYLAKQLISDVTKFTPEIINGSDLSLNGKNVDALALELIDFLTGAGTEEERIHSLLQLKFGLEANNLVEAVKQFEGGRSVEALFADYYEKAKADPTVTESSLKDEIKAAFKAKSLTGKDVFGASLDTVDMDDDTVRLLCVIAARVFEGTGSELAVEEVVSRVCSDSDELELISDSVGKADAIIKKITPAYNFIFCIIIALLIAAAIVLWFHVCPAVNIFVATDPTISLVIIEALIEFYGIAAATTVLGVLFYKLKKAALNLLGSNIAEYEYFKDEENEDSLFVKGLKYLASSGNEKEEPDFEEDNEEDDEDEEELE